MNTVVQALPTLRLTKAALASSGDAVVRRRVSSWSVKARRGALIAAALAAFAVLLLMPLIAVFAAALRNGWHAYVSALSNADALAALRLSLTVLAIVVPINTAFGLATAWVLSKGHFPGKQLLISIVDLPFAVSPVVAGLIFVLLFGAQGWWGSWLAAHGLKVVFALPGIVLASLFVTAPFVARQLLPLMEAQGASEEEAAVLLGAGGWQTFWYVTLPNIRWALLNGVILCTARAMGEFGAVSVISGHIRGLTTTLPLHVEILYNEYHFVAAYAVASLLALFSLLTLLMKQVSEHLSQTAAGRG